MKTEKSRGGKGLSPKLMFVETTETSIRSHLAGQVSYLREAGFDITLVAADQGDLDAFAEATGSRAIALPFSREPSLWADFISLVRLVCLLFRERPDIVAYGTPKAALLTSIAGALARIRRRVYVLHGLRLESMRGMPRRLMWLMEWLTISLSHSTVAVGHGLRAKAVAERLADDSDIRVLGHGSANGVDVARFAHPDRSATETIRSQFNLPASGFLFLFVGRLTRDKGLFELLEAFQQLRKRTSHVFLLIVGAPEFSPGEAKRFHELISLTDGLIVESYRDDVPQLLHAADCLVLPTYREGLPNILLEAAVAKTPIIATDATGVTDIIEDGVSGRIVPVGIAAALQDSMLETVERSDLRNQFADAAKKTVVERFQQSTVWEQWKDFYAELIVTCSLQLRQPDSQSAASAESG